MKSSTVAIIGAGPAGCTLAALLAKQGIRVVVFDDEKRPPLLVGESLVPAVVPFLRQLDIEERTAAIAVRKPGVSFLHRGALEMHFDFQSVAGVLPTYAYNVPRPEFDDLIRQRARELGACFVKHRARIASQPGNAAAELRLDDASLAAAGLSAQAPPALIVDATGRSRLAARSLGIGAQTGPRKDQACFAHFTGISHPFPEGQVVITYHPFGWSWRIPLRERLSFGVVLNSSHAEHWGSSPQEKLDRILADEPRLSPLAGQAKQVTDVFTYTNYQLISDRGHGPRWVAIGDAFGFVDPMLSPGVFLAMESAASIARALAALGRHWAADARKLQRALDAHESAMRGWLAAWQELVAYFYDGRIAQFFVAGMNMRQRHPGSISRFMERMTRRVVACMASGATTRSAWHRGFLQHSVNWLTGGHGSAEYAIS